MRVFLPMLQENLKEFKDIDSEVKKLTAVKYGTRKASIERDPFEQQRKLLRKEDEYWFRRVKELR